jgi:hypothetical protein
MKHRQDGDLKLTKGEIAAAYAAPQWADRYPPVLSVEQAAQLLQVSKATIYDGNSRGLLARTGRKVGKHCRFFRDRLLHRVLNEGIYNNV